MLNRIRAVPMVILLIPLVAAILLLFDPPPKYPPKKAPNAIQTALYGRLQAAGLEEDELATVGALTLGYKEDLDPVLRRHFQASGAAHVLAVSGLHTGIIYGLLLFVLTLGRRFRPRHENRIGRWTIALIIIAVMWGYAYLTGMTPSVVRAVIMVTIVEIGRALYRFSFTLNTIASTAVLILMVHPQSLWSVSFQLSFAATTAIVLLTPIFLPLTQDQEVERSRVLTYILGLIVVSISAQIGTLPITIYYFRQVSTYFLLANLLVLPLASLLVPAGLITIALGGSTLGVFSGKVTWALSWAMNHAVGWIEHLPGSTFPAHTNGWMMLLYYVLLLLFWVFMPKKIN